jgi:uncharacterized protein with HEPN domain
VSSEQQVEGGTAIDRRTAGYHHRQSRIRFRDWRFRVSDMVAAVQAVADYTRDMTFPQFTADRRTVDAVVRNLIVLGESERWIPEPVKDAHPQVPWRLLRGVRNVVVHEYFGVDPAILWETVRGDLPPLLPRLEAVLEG